MSCKTTKVNSYLDEMPRRGCLACDRASCRSALLGITSPQLGWRIGADLVKRGYVSGGLAMKILEAFRKRALAANRVLLLHKDFDDLARLSP